MFISATAVHDYEAMTILVNNRICRKLPVADIRDDSATHLINNPVTLSCTPPIEGDTVTIVMAGSYLTLCEVLVFGEKKGNNTRRQTPIANCDLKLPEETFLVCFLYLRYV